MKRWTGSKVGVLSLSFKALYKYCIIIIIITIIASCAILRTLLTDCIQSRGA